MFRVRASRQNNLILVSSPGSAASLDLEDEWWEDDDLGKRLSMLASCSETVDRFFEQIRTIRREKGGGESGVETRLTAASQQTGKTCCTPHQ